jgi:hypothetical protein
VTEWGGLTRSHSNTAKPLGPFRGALVSLRGQQRCDLRPTASNLMNDESLEEGFDGTVVTVTISVFEISVLFLMIARRNRSLRAKTGISRSDSAL